MAEWTGMSSSPKAQASFSPKGQAVLAGSVQQSPEQSRNQYSGQQGEQTMLYDAICSMCGKPTKVVFPPDGKRPVYCKVCRKKRQQEREGAGFRATPPEKPRIQPQAVSLKEATSSEPVFFQAKANHDREQQKKKEVNRDEVRQALSEAVSQIQRQSATREKKEGVIHPGETISL